MRSIFKIHHHVTIRSNRSCATAESSRLTRQTLAPQAHANTVPSTTDRSATQHHAGTNVITATPPTVSTAHPDRVMASHMVAVPAPVGVAAMTELDDNTRTGRGWPLFGTGTSTSDEEPNRYTDWLMPLQRAASQQLE